jgi:thioredoxin-like negative regulator of GroEL
MRVFMSKLFFLLVFVSFNFLQAYQPKELLFSTASFVEREKKSDGTESSVVRLRGVQQFGEKVLKSKMPVVVKVWAKKGKLFKEDQKNYQEVASKYRGSVSFVSLGISENEEVLRFLMAKLKVKEVTLPLLLFFKDGSLFLPLVSGFVLQEDLHKLVQKKFDFSITQQKGLEELSIKDKSKTDSEKNWSEKLKRMILGFKELSREADAYCARTKWSRSK